MKNNLKVTSQRKDKKGGYIEAGRVKNVKRSPAPNCDTMFLRLRRKGKDCNTLYLRPDEVMDIAWVCMTSFMEFTKI